MINKMKTVLERFSAAFAVLFLGLVAMNYILDFFVKALGMLITEPTNFMRYFLIVVYVIYGLHHASAWYLESQTKGRD
jgi:hypothetical protein